MAKILDDIQEELKREDLFRRLQKIAPYVLGLLISILLGVAYYSWHIYRQEKNLDLWEKSYVKATQLFKNGHLNEAEKEFFRLLPQRGFENLSLLYLESIQKRKQESGEPSRPLDEESKKQLSQGQKQFKTQIAFGPLRDFLLLASSFSGDASKQEGVENKSLLFPELSPSARKNLITSMTTASHTWYTPALAWTCLAGYRNHVLGKKEEGKIKIFENFQKWLKGVKDMGEELPHSMGWISQTATMGAEYVLYPQSLQEEGHISDLNPKNKERISKK